jgi:hypothetical protein
MTIHWRIATTRSERLGEAEKSGVKTPKAATRAERGQEIESQKREGTRNTRRVSLLTALDDFRNWLALGLQPAKGHENQVPVRMAPAGAARSNRASGAVEAEQLFDPERA